MKKRYINKITGLEVKPSEWTWKDVIKAFVLGTILGTILGVYLWV